MKLLETVKLLTCDKEVLVSNPCRETNSKYFTQRLFPGRVKLSTLLYLVPRPKLVEICLHCPICS
jgi:hypothetical protein